MAEPRSYNYQDMATARAVIVLAGGAIALALVLIPALWQVGTPTALAGAAGLGLMAVFALVKGFEYGEDSGLMWEYRYMRPIFKAVCERNRLVLKDGNGRNVYPRLSKLVGNRRTFTATIHPLRGQSFKDWENNSGAFDLAYGSVGIRLMDNGDGTLTMRGGYQAMEPRPVMIPPDIPDDGRSWRQRLSAVPVAVTDGGRPFMLPAIDTHLLVAGESGSGKGSVVWSLLFGILPAIRAGAVKVWAFDPKRVELALGRQFFAHYASDVTAMVELAEKAVADMMERADRLAGKTRKFDPSPELPMNILVIDELAYMSSMLPDKKLQERANKAMQTLLVLGRATGYMVVGCTQDPRVETIKHRDLYPTRVALRMKAGAVDLVLGPGARAAGALCDMIPDPRTGGGAGVAFVMGETSHAPTCVRMTWADDNTIMRTAGELGGGSPVPLLGGA